MQPNARSNLRTEHDTEPVWAAQEGHVASATYYLTCLLFCWLVIPILLALARFIRVSRHTYTLTEQRLREQSGVFFRRTEDLELYRVKDLSIEQPLLQRLVGCGRILLVTTDQSSPIVALEAIPNPVAVADLIRDYVERCRVNKGVWNVVN